MAPDFAPGTLIDGRYKLISRLGSGGMADVYLAEDHQLGRKVALKLLHRRFAQDPGFVERFRREAQAAARLQHPNIVGVYDRGAFEDTSYIAMEYLPGRSLKQLIREEAPLAPPRAIDITIQILQAARFAHRHGVIHRDLKPHNVIVDDADQIKVTDFGIARAGASDMTETGSIMGTAQYLSPEQAQGHAVSAASDLYSVGVVLYELLTGRVPFEAESPVTIALKHVSAVPTAPARLNAMIPPELDQVVMWALNKDPADRPQDADQLIDALERAKAVIESGRRGEATAAIPALAGVGAYRAAAAMAASPAPPRHADVLVGDADGGPPPEEEPQPEEEERRRRRWPWLVLLLVALAIAAAVAGYLLTRPVRAVVPSVVGQNINNASTILQNDNFAVTTINVANPKPSGTVIHQSPQPDTKANEGSTVTLTVSTGPGNVNVPGVVNLPLAQAEKTLRAHGLTIGSVTHANSDSVAAGNVINTVPAAGTPVQGGSSIELIVSSGRANVTVPDVTGESVGDAKAQLSANFNVTTSTRTSTATPGTVIDQSPRGGTPVPPGSTVHLVVATAPTTANVPDVRGQTAAAAASQLTQAGFQVVQRTSAVSDQSKDGIVLSESPAQGSTRPKGTTVTIVVGKFQPPPSTPTTPTTTGTATATTATTGTTPTTR